MRGDSRRAAVRDTPAREARRGERSGKEKIGKGKGAARSGWLCKRPLQCWRRLTVATVSTLKAPCTQPPPRTHVLRRPSTNLLSQIVRKMFLLTVSLSRLPAPAFHRGTVAFLSSAPTRDSSLRVSFYFLSSILLLIVSCFLVCVICFFVRKGENPSPL